MSGMNGDRELWRRAQQREEAAFTQLRQQYTAYVRGAIRQNLRELQADDLEDLEQRVWLAVWNALPGFRGEASFSTWVVGIARYQAFGWIRGRNTEQQAIVRIKQDIETERPLEPIEQTVETLVFRNALENLSPEEQIVIRFRYFQQLTVQEVALRTEIPLGTVKKRLSTALLKLKRFLSDE